MKVKCQICGEDAQFKKIALSCEDDLKICEAIYCLNCGHGVFDFNELNNMLNDFSTFVINKFERS